MKGVGVPITIFLCFALCAVVGVNAGTAGTVLRPIMNCSDLISPNSDFTQIPNLPTRIVIAEEGPDAYSGLNFCHVEGWISPQIYFISYFPINTYTQRWVNMGEGSYAGYEGIIAIGFGATGFELTGNNSQMSPYLKNGLLAYSQTTGGHYATYPGYAEDGLWANNDGSMATTWAYKSEDALFNVTQAILTKFYGQPAAKNYYISCSGGGRQGLMTTQRYSNTQHQYAFYDGVSAWAPAQYQVELPVLHHAWLCSKNMAANGSYILTTDKLAALHNASLNACDLADGVADRLIRDPRDCVGNYSFNPASIQCPSGVDTSSCLTAPQVAVVQAYYAGVRDAVTGELLYPGVAEIGSETSWGTYMTVPDTPDAEGISVVCAYALNFARYLATFTPQPTLQISDFNFTAGHLDSLTETMKLYDATSTNLDDWKAAGGKLILTTGFADPVVPSNGVINYWAGLLQRYGAVELNEFVALYTVPGCWHCDLPTVNAGGADNVPNNIDMASVLIAWVENGTNPGAVPASTPLGNSPVITRPICRYPLEQVYIGGNIDLAASFTCNTTVAHNDTVVWEGNFTMDHKWCNYVDHADGFKFHCKNHFF